MRSPEGRLRARADRAVFFSGRCYDFERFDRAFFMNRPLTRVACGFGLLVLAAWPAPLAAESAIAQGPGSGDRVGGLVEEGLAALAAGDLGTAEERFSEAAAREPQRPEVWLGLAGVREQEGEPLAALELTRRAERLAPGMAAAALASGRLLARIGAAPAAIAALARARALDPADPRPYLLAALLHRDTGEIEEAIGILREASERGLESAEIDRDLGLLLLAVGEPGAALAAAEAGLGRRADDAGLLLVKGLALAADPARRGEAAGWLERALAGGAPQPGRIHLELGTLVLERQGPAAALAHLTEAARLLPDSPEAQYRLATARLAAGDAEGSEAAMARFRQLSELRDARERAAKETGIALNEAQELALANRLPEALARIGELLAREPANGRAHALRAKLLFSLGRPDEALASIARARELEPARSEYPYLEGLCLLHLGRPAEAERALLGAVALDSGLGEAWSLLGGAAVKLERPAAAVERFQRALDLGADGPSLRLGYAAALESLGRGAESEEQMRAYRRLTKGPGEE